MRTWTRVGEHVIEHCGGCGETLKSGQPMQVITPDPSRNFKSKRPIVRCVFCAEGTPPADLPPLVSKTLPLQPMVMIPTGPGTLPLDFKPDRDPGQEG